MGINFPNAPAIDQLYPQPPVTGLPVYRWDGEKWTTKGGTITGKLPIYADGSTPMSAQLTVVAPPVNPTDATAKSYVDSRPPPAGSVRYDAAQALSIAQQSQGRANVAVVGRNVLINGGFAISQRGQNAQYLCGNNGYCIDRWRYLGEANALVIREAPANLADPAGLLTLPFNAAITAQDTTSKGGLFQVIEGKNCQHMRGKTVVLSAIIQSSNPASLGNFKMGILEWTGAEDTVSAAPVSAWNAEGTNPTLAAGWAFINVPANLNVSAAIALNSVSATLGTTFKNLAVMIWYDDKTHANGDFTRIGNVQLEIGSVPTPFEMLSFSQTLAQCARYFTRSYDLLVATQAASAAGYISMLCNGTVVQLFNRIPFSSRMRVSPTVVMYSYAGTVGVWSNTGGVDQAGAGSLAPTEDAIYSGGNSVALTLGSTYLCHYTASAEL